MILATTDDIRGREISEVLGMVRGNSVRARNLFRDVLAVFKNMVGGELDGYTKLMGEVREQSIDRMVAEARVRGANAIVGVRFSSTEISRGAAEMLVYGTAVILE